MNRKLVLVVGVGGALFLQESSAYDLTFIPRIGLGMQKYKMEWGGYYPESSPNSGQKFGNAVEVDENLPSLIIGGTVLMDRWYADAYVQQTDTSDETANSFDRTDQREAYAGRRYHNLSKLDRRDYALAIGYSFENGLNVFGGYKYGKSDISTRYTSALYSANGEEQPTDFIGNEDATFKSHGPFLGLGYGLKLGPGILSLTGALAFLDGKTTNTERLPDGMIYSESKPSAEGLSLSLAWKAPITKQLFYGISLDSYQYNFDKETSRLTNYAADGTVEHNNSIPLKVKEESVGIKASLSYSF